MKQNWKALDKISQYLMKKETITGKKFIQGVSTCQSAP